MKKTKATLTKKGKVEAESKMASTKTLIGILLTTVILITLIIYGSNLSDHFVDFDDSRSVCENPVVLASPTITGIKTIFTTNSPDGNYDPLVRLSYMIDYALYGFDGKRAYVNAGNINPQVVLGINAISQTDYIGATGYHITDILLHCLSVLLLFFFCYRLSNSAWVGAIVSLLFGIHPMHVESVAWISERKDQLYALFYFAAMLTYLLYLQKTKWKTRYLLLTALFFLLSLFSKGQAVTLPVVLLLIDYYKGIKIDFKNILVKILLFALAIVFGFVAIHAQKNINSFENTDVSYPFFTRIFFTCYALFTYLWKMILPIHLSAFYPYPVKTNGLYPFIVYISPAIVLALIGIVIWKFHTNKSVIFGTSFFLINIILLLQLIPVGDAIVAERYSYLPYAGLFFIAAVWIVNYFENKNLNSTLRNLKPFIAASLGIYFIFLGYSSYAQAGIWQNSKSLWQNAYKTFPKAERVCGNLSEVYLSEFKIDTALNYLDSAAKLKSTQAYIVRSSVYMAIGNNDSALADCNHVLRQDKIPDSSKLFDVYLNRAHVYTIKNKFDSAVADCNSALALKAINPRRWYAYKDRGIVFMTAGKLDAALSDFYKVLQADPDLPDIHIGVGNIYIMKNMPDSAIANFSKVITATPNYAPAYYRRSVAYQLGNNYPQALNDMLTAQKMGMAVPANDIDVLKTKVNSEK